MDEFETRAHSRRPWCVLLFLLSSALGLATRATAQEAQRASSTLFVRADGDDVKVVVQIRVEDGFHIGNGPTSADAGGTLPTTLTMIGAGFEWSAPRFPKPVDEPDVVEAGKFIHVHYGTFAVQLRGKRTSPTADATKLQVKVEGQTCDANGCTIYEETVASKGNGPDRLFAKFPSDLVVGAAKAVGGSDAAKPASAPNDAAKRGVSDGTIPAQPTTPADLQRMGLAGFLGTAVLYGLLALLMPCTYPMIPITLSFFTKQASSHHASLVPLAFTYGFGIVAIYTGIGVAVGEAIVPFAFHWATNVVFALLFVVLGLSMVGVFLLQPPQFLLNLSSQATRHGGYGGVFVMGATLVVTSFTCTGPFVASLLAIGASGGGHGRVALGMAVFGLTMAVPFVALAMLPGRVKQLPKSGEWMHSLKVTLGFVEIAAAFKFVSNVDLGLQAHVFPRELFLFLVAGTFAIAAFYLFGFLRLDEDVQLATIEAGAAVKLHTSVSPKRMAAGLAFFLFALYCLYGALGNRMDGVMTSLSPPYSNRIFGDGGAATDASAKPQIVMDDLDAACAEAERQGKLVLVNFTGFQ